VLAAAALPAAAQGFNLLLDIGGVPPFPWPVYLDRAAGDPWIGGLAATGMVVTTLVPTAVHLLAAGLALLVPRFAVPAGDTLPPLGTRYLRFMQGFVLPALLSWAALALVGLVLFALASAALGHHGGALIELARCSGSLVGGPGAPACAWR